MICDAWSMQDFATGAYDKATASWSAPVDSRRQIPAPLQAFIEFARYATNPATREAAITAFAKSWRRE